jgi:2-isopropylmalate synthase
VVRINSQSGKGGVSYILQSEYGLDLPRKLQIDFTQVIQKIADDTGKEITPKAIWSAFDQTYVSTTVPFEFVEHQTRPDTHASERRLMTATIRENGQERIINGKGNGPIDSFVDALKRDCGVSIRVRDYHEHAIGGGADARAAAYVEAETEDGQIVWGVGMHLNIVTASLRAVMGAVNRAVMVAGTGQAAEDKAAQ